MRAACGRMAARLAVATAPAPASVAAHLRTGAAAPAPLPPAAAAAAHAGYGHGPRGGERWRDEVQGTFGSGGGGGGGGRRSDRSRSPPGGMHGGRDAGADRARAADADAVDAAAGVLEVYALLQMAERAVAASITRAERAGVSFAVVRQAQSGASSLLSAAGALADTLPPVARAHVPAAGGSSSLLCAFPRPAATASFAGRASGQRAPVAFASSSSSHTGGTPAPTLLLRFDGSCRGNPGMGGAAAVLFTADGGTELAYRAVPMPSTTNNRAEYSGLLVGLRLARALAVSRLRVEGDSELVVKQVHGTYAVRDATLATLHAQVVALLRGFHAVTVAHIPRAANHRADVVSNMAANGVDALVLHDAPLAAAGCNPTLDAAAAATVTLAPAR